MTWVIVVSNSIFVVHTYLEFNPKSDQDLDFMSIRKNKTGFATFYWFYSDTLVQIQNLQADTNDHKVYQHMYFHKWFQVCKNEQIILMERMR